MQPPTVTESLCLGIFRHAPHKCNTFLRNNLFHFAISHVAVLEVCPETGTVVGEQRVIDIAKPDEAKVVNFEEAKQQLEACMFHTFEN